MRISDWSSDVCSSDLRQRRAVRLRRSARGVTMRRQNDVAPPARRLVGFAVMLGAVCVPLFFSKSFDLARFELAIVVILAAVGFNFAFGISGQLAIGQPVLLAVGGYTAGILSATRGWGFAQPIRSE